MASLTTQRHLLLSLSVYLLAACTSATDSAPPHLGIARNANEHVPPTTWIPVPPPEYAPPDPAGGLLGAHRVTPTGSLQYNIPLAIPKGRRDLTPSLSLAYDSNSPQGYLGVGWSLNGFSSIARCPSIKSRDGATSGISFTATDNFCFNGQKLVELETPPDPPQQAAPMFGPAGNYREFRTELDASMRFFAWVDPGSPTPEEPLSWTAIYPNGHLLQFGSNPTTRAHYPHADGRTVTLGWMVNRRQDLYGNFVTYLYSRDPNLQEWPLRPERIAYTGGPGPLSPNRSVEFLYEANIDNYVTGDPSDRVSHWYHGVRLDNHRRLVSLRTYAPATTDDTTTQYPGVSYRLDYLQSEATRRSLLHSIEQCDGGDPLLGTEPTCLPGKVHIAYGDSPTLSFTSQTLPLPFPPRTWVNQPDSIPRVTWNPNTEIAYYGLVPTLLALDYNGDGATDLLLDQVLENTLPPVAAAAHSYHSPVVVRATPQGYQLVASTLPSLYPHSPDPPLDDYELYYSPFQRLPLNLSGTARQAILSEVQYWPGAASPERSLRLASLSYSGNNASFLGNWSTPPYNTYPGSHAPDAVRSISIGDFNGDGLADVLAHQDAPTPGSFELVFYLNDGHSPCPLNAPGCQPSFTIASRVPSDSRPDSQARRLHVLDVDGDGKDEIVEDLSDLGLLLGSSTHELTIHGLDQATHRVPDTPSLRDATLADINGDGLKDIVRFLDFDPATGSYQPPTISYNTAAGFTAFQALSSAPWVNPLDLSPDAKPFIRAADMNGDGRDDLIFITAPEVPPTDGDGTPSDGFGLSEVHIWLTTTEGVYPSYSLPREFVLNVLLGDQASSGIAIVDHDNDGRLDIAGLVQTASLTWELRTYAQTDDLYTDRATTIRDGLGKTVAIQYGTARPNADEPPTYTSSNDCEFPEQCVKTVWPLVSRIQETTLDSPVSTDRERWYRYDTFIRDGHGRGVVGVRSYEVIEEATSTLFEYDLTRFEGGRYPFAHRPSTLQQVTTTANETLTHTEFHQPLYIQNVDGTYFTTTVTEESMTESSLGGPILHHIYEVLAFTPTYTPRVLFQRVGGETTLLTRTFEDDFSTWQLDRLTSEHAESTASGETLTRWTGWSYNAQGDVVQVEKQGCTLYPNCPAGTTPDPSEYLLTTLTIAPDSGATTQITEEDLSGLSRTLSLGWDPDSTYIVSRQYANGLAEYVAYYPHWGVPAQTADVNGNLSQFSYDSVGRLIRDSPHVGGTTSYEYTLPGSPSHAMESGFAIRTKHPIGTETVDSYDANGLLSHRLQYDRRGATQQTVFTYDSDHNIRTIVRPSEYVETFTYDEAGRPLSHDSPSVHKEWSYPSLLHIRTTTAAGNGSVNGISTDQFYDSGGRLKERRRWNSHLALYQSIYAEYGPFNLLTKLTDAAGHDVRYQHDSLGRLVAIKGHPSAGSVTHTYNAFGDLVHEVRDGHDLANPAGLTRDYQYDSLGRLTTSISEHGTDTFVYDGPHGGGELHYALSADGHRVEYVFNALGQRASEIYTHAGQLPVTFSYRYDTFGRLEEIDYPQIGGSSATALTVRYGYDQVGQLESIRAGKDELYRVEARNRFNHVTRATYGTTLSLTQDFEPANPARLVSREVDQLHELSSPTRILDMSYDHWDNGLLRSRVDGINDITETYEYDSLDRLSYWSHTHDSVVRTKAFVFDAQNRLVEELDSPSMGTGKSFDYTDPLHPFAPTVVGGRTISYDQLGRQVGNTDPGTSTRTVSEYMAFDLARSGSIDGQPFSLTYGAFGDLATQTIGGITLRDFGHRYQRRESFAGVEHSFLVYSDDGVVARFTPTSSTLGDADFFLPDYDGGVRLSFDSSTETAEYSFRDPYGASIDVEAQPSSLSNSSRVGLGGHQYRESLGLYHMGGRQFDATLRSFASPDPFTSDAFHSSSFGGYNYGGWNPINRRDPSGLQTEEGSNGAPMVPPSEGHIISFPGMISLEPVPVQTRQARTVVPGVYFDSQATPVFSGDGDYRSGLARTLGVPAWLEDAYIRNVDLIAAVPLGISLGAMVVVTRGVVLEAVSASASGHGVVGLADFLGVVARGRAVATASWAAFSSLVGGGLQAATNAWQRWRLMIPRSLPSFRSMSRMSFRVGQTSLRASGGCFVQGTMVMTPFGEKAIDSLIVGDLVVAVDDTETLLDSGQNGSPSRAQLFRPKEEAWTLAVNGSPSSIQVDGGQLVLVEGRGWLHVESLSPGSRIWSSDGWREIVYIFSPLQPSY